MAVKFNRAYEGDFLVEPEEYIVKSVATVPGTDGQKMSKSYDNTLAIFDQPKALKKKIMSILTDSTPLEEPKNPSKDNVFALISLFASQDQKEEIAQKYRAGGYGYGHAKKELLTLMSEYFAEATERRRELNQHPERVYEVLQEGAKKARIQAECVMQPIREVVGLHRSF